MKKQLTITLMLLTLLSVNAQKNKEIEIFGYTNELSFLPGETVDFHVSTNAPEYSIRIERVGQIRKNVWEKGEIKGKHYKTPDKAYEVGCNWPKSESFKIPNDLKSGYYSVMFMTENTPGYRAQWEHFFVVRSANPGVDNKAVLVIATSTYHAYNNWGGSNLYEGAHKVSTKRPFMEGLLSKPELQESRIADLGEPNEGYTPDALQYLEKYNFPLWVGAAGYATYEGQFVKWAEGEGYEFDYAISEDLETRPEVLDNYNLMVSFGHDEYWSWNMRDAVENRIEKGLNVAFFTGNSIYWQVRFEDEGDTMVCYKYEAGEIDPIVKTKDKHLMTTTWSDKRVGRTENSLLGVSFNYAGYTRIAGSTPKSASGYQIYRPNHWVFENTDLRWGDQLGIKSSVVGYEVDGCAYDIKDGLPVPTGKDGTPLNTEILAMAPASLWNTEDTPQEAMGKIPDAEMAALSITGDRKNWKRYTRGMAAMIIYTRGEGTVFNASSTDWVWGLADGDKEVEQVTRNVLEKLVE